MCLRLNSIMFVIFDFMCLTTALFLTILNNQELTILCLLQGRKQLVYLDAFYYELSQKLSNAHIIKITNSSDFSHNCLPGQADDFAERSPGVGDTQWTSTVTMNVQKAPFSPPRPRPDWLLFLS